MILKIDGVGTEHALERRRCMTDLFYLGKNWLKYDFVESVHRPVCDLFVHKNPDRPFEEQDEIKYRMLLDPRGHFKTTIDGVDIVQWIICFPNIRVSVFSGSDDIVRQISEQSINHFRINDEFKTLFFEHAVDPRKDISLTSFTTPARTQWNRRGPSLFATTIGSVNTGTHCEVMKFDDAVNDKNSKTAEMRASTARDIGALAPLVVPGGYTDYVGTRYAFDDAYGLKINKLEDPKIKQVIAFGSITHAPNWKVFCRQVGTLPLNEKSEYLFPVDAFGKPAFDYKEVKRRMGELDNPVQFGCQYLNDPQWGQDTKFEEADLRAAMIPFQSIPLESKHALSGQRYISAKVFQVWDLAFSTKKHADRTVCATGAYDKFGRLYLLDLEAGRFSADELVYKFLASIRKWYFYMGRVGIEDAAGSKLIGPALRTAALHANIPLPIDWLPVSPDKTKAERIFGLIPLLKAKKLFINNAIPFKEDLIREFTQYPKGRHDDIPDAVSRLLEYQSAIDLQALVPPERATPIERYDSPLGYGINC